MMLISLPLSIFAGVINEIDDPSAYGASLGGALYASYTGPQSIAYNPAGIAEGSGGLFFSHIEHYFGMIRNEYLSGDIGFDNFYAGGAIESTYPVTVNMNYFQYMLSGALAYRYGASSIGMNLNAWTGSDILGGFSMDFGGITKIGAFDLGFVIKNAFASITWSATGSTLNSSVEQYPAELIAGLGYSIQKLEIDGFANITSSECGIGAKYSITDFFSVIGGYKMVIGSQPSNALSAGIMIKNYFGFDIFVSYIFQDPFKFGDTINPFYMSMNYSFGGK